MNNADTFKKLIDDRKAYQKTSATAYVPLMKAVRRQLFGQESVWSKDGVRLEVDDEDMKRIDQGYEMVATLRFTTIFVDLTFTIETSLSEDGTIVTWVTLPENDVWHCDSATCYEAIAARIIGIFHEGVGPKVIPGYTPKEKTPVVPNE